ncbi:MAG: hypothetical protein R3F19_11350 [Verrucomicrobiales bacterium]
MIPAPGATAEGITYTAHQLYEKHKRKMRKAGEESRAIRLVDLSYGSTWKQKPVAILSGSR